MRNPANSLSIASFPVCLLTMIAMGLAQAGPVRLESGKPTVQSSTFHNDSRYDSSKAVDNQASDQSVAQTELEDNPWWEIDLQGDHAIDSITVLGPAAYGAGWLRTFQVLLSSDGLNYKSIYTHNGSAFRSRVVPVGGLSARYVRIRLRERQVLALQEVQIFENGPAASRSGPVAWKAEQIRDARHARSGKSCSLTLEAGTDRYGSDYTNLQTMSAEACCKSCEGERGCLSYSYYAPNKTCYLKSAVPSTSENEDVTSGVRAGVPPPAACSLTMEAGTDRYGGDYTNLQAVSAESCCKSCEGDERCLSYSWYAPNKTCYLKSAVPSTSGNTSITSGVRAGAAPSSGRCSLTLEKGTDRFGGDYTNLETRTAEACCKSCDGDRQCLSYAWNTPSKRCYLKSTVPPVSGNADVTSGAKAQ